MNSPTIANQRRAVTYAPALALLLLAVFMSPGCQQESNLYGNDPPPQEDPNS